MHIFYVHYSKFKDCALPVSGVAPASLFRGCTKGKNLEVCVF